MIEWYGIAAPSATPPAIVRKLSADLLQVLGMTDVRERIAQSGQTVSPLGSEEFGRMMRADFERWRKVVAAAGIRPE